MRNFTTTMLSSTLESGTGETLVKNWRDAHDATRSLNRAPGIFISDRPIGVSLTLWELNCDDEDSEHQLGVYRVY